MATVVMTAIGNDRAGLVSALADVIERHGGNWQRSRMSELAGTFAGIVEVAIPDGEADALIASLEPLAGVLDVQVRLGVPEQPPTRELRLDLTGSDRHGIVREVGFAMSVLGVSIEQLETQTRDAPMAGGTVFEAHAVLALPDGVEPDDVRRALEALADELMVELSPVLTHGR